MNAKCWGKWEHTKATIYTTSIKQTHSWKNNKTLQLNKIYVKPLTRTFPQYNQKLLDHISTTGDFQQTLSSGSHSFRTLTSIHKCNNYRTEFKRERMYSNRNYGKDYMEEMHKHHGLLSSPNPSHPPSSQSFPILLLSHGFSNCTTVALRPLAIFLFLDNA